MVELQSDEGITYYYGRPSKSWIRKMYRYWKRKDPKFQELHYFYFDVFCGIGEKSCHLDDMFNIAGFQNKMFFSDLGNRVVIIHVPFFQPEVQPTVNSSTDRLLITNVLVQNQQRAFKEHSGWWTQPAGIKRGLI